MLGMLGGAVPALTLIEALSRSFFLLACCLALTPSRALTKERRPLEVKHEFQQQHPCPSTGHTSGHRPGYVKDHVVPLACGGPDSASNMQWQTVEAAKAKDKWETKGCGR